MVLPKGFLKHISPKRRVFDCQDNMLGGRVLQRAGSSYTCETSYRCFSRKNEKKLSRSFNVTFHYTDDVFFLNTFCEFVIRIYSIELEIKDTTDPTRSALYLELHVEIDNEWRIRTKLCDKRDDFNFPKIRRGPSKDKVFNLRCSFVFIKHI
jgi:hypothetical protein